MRDSDTSTPSYRRIRLVSLVEAETITGPMKPLLMFARNIQTSREVCTGILHSVVTTIRAPRRRPLGTNNFLRAAEAAGLSVDVIRERYLFDWAVLPQLSDCLAARMPQIIETHDFKSHFLIWILKKTHRIPNAKWIAFHHGYTRMSVKVRVYQQLDRISLRAADRVVTVCRPFVLQLVQRGVKSSRIKILANAIESRAHPPQADILHLKQKLGLSPTDRIITTVGRLSAEKGHATLIAAYRILLKEFGLHNLRLLLVGDGGEVNSLKAAAQDLGAGVVFVGHVDDPWPYYCLSEVFVLPSYSEGSPLALLEAMSAGLPIIASAVGGIPETLCAETSALLVRPGAVRELACALARVLGDSNLAKRLALGASEVAQQFTPARYIQDRISIYESLLAPAAD
jgi:glycosyltransferase involved in cell wall biosynthesis